MGRHLRFSDADAEVFGRIAGEFLVVVREDGSRWWTQKRLRDEHRAVTQLYEMRSLAGKAGGRRSAEARRLKTLDMMRNGASFLHAPNAKQTATNAQAPTPTPTLIEEREVKRSSKTAAREGESSPARPNGHDPQSAATVAARCRTLAGQDVNPAWSTAVVYQLLADGCDPDLDIYPTIEAMMAEGRGEKAKSLKYFEPAIRERAAQRKVGAAHANGQRVSKNASEAENREYDAIPWLYHTHSEWRVILETWLAGLEKRGAARSLPLWTECAFPWLTTSDFPPRILREFEADERLRAMKAEHEQQLAARAARDAEIDREREAAQMAQRFGEN